VGEWAIVWVGRGQLSALHLEQDMNPHSNNAPVNLEGLTENSHDNVLL